MLPEIKSHLNASLKWTNYGLYTIATAKRIKIKTKMIQIGILGKFNTQNIIINESTFEEDTTNNERNINKQMQNETEKEKKHSVIHSA